MRFITVLFILINFSNYSKDTKGELIITINNLKSNKGKVLFALYSSEDSYLNEKKAVKLKVCLIKNNKAIIKMNGLSFGNYAFAFYHDSNNNSKLDKNIFGIPKEDYGFSNDARGTFGPPSFKASKFKLYKKQQKISLNMR